MQISLSICLSSIDHNDLLNFFFTLLLFYWLQMWEKNQQNQSLYCFFSIIYLENHSFRRKNIGKNQLLHLWFSIIRRFSMEIWKASFEIKFELRIVYKFNLLSSMTVIFSVVLIVAVDKANKQKYKKKDKRMTKTNQECK